MRYRDNPRFHSLASDPQFKLRQEPAQRAVLPIQKPKGEIRKRLVGLFMLAVTAGGAAAWYWPDGNPEKTVITPRPQRDENVTYVQRFDLPHAPGDTRKRVKPEIIKLPHADAAAALVFKPIDSSKACAPGLVHADRFAAVAAIRDMHGHERVALDVGGTLLRHPASLTKMMTLLVAFQQIEAQKMSLREQVSFSPYARLAPRTNIRFERAVKHRWAVEEVMMAIGVRSANDAARALAEKIAGSEAAFVTLMNDDAKMIGMTSTVFRNASGLHDPQQVTTAHDMLKLETYLEAKYPSYMKFLSTREYRLHPGVRIGKKKTLTPLVLSTGNELLKEELEGGWIVDSAKTGYIHGSGFNMALLAHRFTRAKKREELRLVVMGGKSKASRNACIEAIAARL